MPHLQLDSIVVSLFVIDADYIVLSYYYTDTETRGPVYLPLHPIEVRICLQPWK